MCSVALFLLCLILVCSIGIAEQSLQDIIDEDDAPYNPDRVTVIRPNIPKNRVTVQHESSGFKGGVTRTYNYKGKELQDIIENWKTKREEKRVRKEQLVDTNAKDGKPIL